MWKTIARYILRNRIIIIVVLAGITVFMGWQVSKVQIQYEYPRLLPTDDSISVQYDDFKKRFGEHMCVGCGRCDDNCPEYISYSSCINRLNQVIQETDACVKTP